MRFHFVVNPQAGRVRTAEIRAAIDRHFRPEEVRIHLGLPSGDDRSWAPPDRVVAVGGDGTVHRVVNAVAGSRCAIGIVPRGTSNDLARELGIPFDLDEACALVRDGTTMHIDLVEVNTALVATAGGLGVPASIADRANRWKAARGVWRLLTRVLGRGVYVAAALFELTGRWRPVRGSVGEHGPRERWAALVVSNQPALGPFSASPDARHRDGFLDVCEIEAPRPAGRMLWIALRMLRGQGDRCAEVRQRRARSLVLECREPQAFLADGEILERARRFEIRIRPHALEVVAPARDRPHRGPAPSRCIRPASADGPRRDRRVPRAACGGPSLFFRKFAAAPPPRPRTRVR